MAIFRKGIKIGKYDIRTGVTKKRAQALLRKLDIIQDDKGRKKYEKDARGEVQMIRTAVAQAEGFTFPVNYQLKFQPPRGIEQPIWDKTKRDGNEGRRAGQLSLNAPVAPPNGDWVGGGDGHVRGGGIDWKTHKMNFSLAGQKSGVGTIWEKYNEAAKVAATLWNKNKENTIALGEEGKKQRIGDIRTDTTLNLFCSKVTIPEKSINVTQIKQYGSHFPWPQSVSYGTLTTTFYCDGAMKIKTFFDAWQKLIWNDLTGNFNYYNEYVSEFDIFTRATIAKGGSIKAGTSTDKHQTQEWATELSDSIKAGTKWLNDATGVDGPRDGKQVGENKVPSVEFRNNYGVKIFQCFPQIVGSIDLAHSSTDSISEFNVTWVYKKWNPFKMGDVGNRSQINLAVGEFRNEKDGFPFLEDLPPELSGPLTSAVNQGIVTGPLSKASNLFG